MHTVVSGWFGVSTIWFAPLAWRLAKAVLPGGTGLRGPGTIRLWLGFTGVLAASCALEASLLPGTGNALGHALFARANHAPGALGRIGAPLAALVVVLGSLPWFIGFRWQDALRTADRAFGLGLGSSPSRGASGSARQAKGARPQAARDDDARARPAGVNAMRVATINTMAPKPGGRYARPTVWRPTAVPHGSLGGKTADVPPDAETMPPAARPNRESPRSATGMQADSGGRAARPVPSPARAPGAARAAPSSSWTRAISSGKIASPAAARSPSPPLRPMARPMTRPLPVGAKPAAPLAALQRGSAVAPLPGVEETLRAIEANTAQWTALAGIGLARRSASGLQVCPAQEDADEGRANAARTPQFPSSRAVPPTPNDGARAPITFATVDHLENQRETDATPAADAAQGPNALSPEVEGGTEWRAEPDADAQTVAASRPDVSTKAPTAPIARAERGPMGPSPATVTQQAAPADSTPSPLASAAVLTGSIAADPAPVTPATFAVLAANAPGGPVPAAAASAEPGPAEAASAEAAPAEPAPAEATPAAATPAEAAPAEAAPADAAALAATVPAEPAPPDPPSRPAIRGHAATEFAFHAPAAAAVELPSLDLLERPSADAELIPAEHLAQTGQLIEQRLQEFKVPVTVVGASAGPVITRFEVEPALGVRGSQIVGLMKDLSRGLGLTSIRVVETIPGKTCMGLELPNAKRQMIRLSEIFAAGVYRQSASRLTIAMGKDITGHPVVTDLAKAPHMLVAGTTGSGKSVAINAMILSLLFKATPEDVRLIMIDPKMLELSVYEGIPHLLAPVVTDMKLAANALNWCVGEMEKRYRLMSAVGVRNLAGFNQKVRDAEAGEKKLTNPFSLTPEAPEPLSTLPLIVVVIDELADLMMVAGKKIEELIARLAQKARAAGIHLILATQRPSVDVITGLIKANIPTRVAFQVSSKIDSRTILDQMGAESLLGQGDMLFLPPGTGYPQRVHGAFVADEEVHRIVEHLKQFGEPQYEEGILEGPATEGSGQDLFGDAPDAEADPLYDEAVAFVVRTRRASISAVQRQLRIGYNRAARLVEQMETAGLVSSMSINGSREVLAPPGPEQ